VPIICGSPVWGGAGNDIIEGGGGDDFALGGEGNDIITDLGGNDVLKGGPGNDALDGGIGNDIFMGGDGSDFINGGANDNESFAGPGNDFIIAGQGADAVFGDGGDDWIQGGAGQDLLQGDHAAPFFDDPAQVSPGNDIFVGQVGENDYDAEGGDDIMSQNAAIDRNAGAAGFDWAIHQYDTVGANDDMNINNNLVGVPIQVVVNRDRWQETEADSGSAFNDVIKGNTTVPAAVAGAGFAGCNAIDAAGVARISGLDALVTTFPSPLAPIVASSTAGFCPLNSGSGTGNVWGEGDILLGGLGSDTIEGRGGNDILDGDRSLEVHITVRTNPSNAATETGRTDLMEHAATSGSFGAGTAGMTLQQAVFAGLVDPGNLVAVREIVSPTAPAADCAAAAPVNCDSAVFSGVRANYTVTTVPTGAVVGSAGSVTTVTDNVGTDGTDTLRNFEVLQFADSATPNAPTAVTATGGVGRATVSWAAPLLNRVAQVVTSYKVEVSLAGTVVGTLRPTVGNVLTLDVTGLAAGSYTFRVLASNAAATPTDGPLSVPSAATTVTAAALPGAPTIGAPTAGTSSATVRWTAPASDGGSAITGYSVRVVTAAAPTVTVGVLRPAAATATSLVVTGLTPGTAYRFQVAAINVVGTGPLSVLSTSVTPTALVTVPGAPTIGAAAAVVAANTAFGNGPALVRWTAPAVTGGSVNTGFSVRVVTSAAPTVQVGALRTAAAGTTSLTVSGLAGGTAYRFQVRARNVAGPGAFSGLSNAVTSTTVPAAPGILPANPGAIRGVITATANWLATPAASNGGSAITGYRVTALRMSAAGLVIGQTASAVLPATARTLSMTLPAPSNNYRFVVQAINARGASASSIRSNLVTAR